MGRCGYGELFLFGLCGLVVFLLKVVKNKLTTFGNFWLFFGQVVNGCPNCVELTRLEKTIAPLFKEA